MKIRKLPFLVIEILILLFISFRIVSATATYIFFNVEPDDQEEAIFIEWETNIELDNAGFYVQRSLAETGPYLRISGYFPSQSPDGINGAYYSYYDQTIQVNTIYYYRIESVDVDGLSAFSEIRSTRLESVGTSMPTITATSESTPEVLSQTATPEISDTPTPVDLTPLPRLTDSETKTPASATPTAIAVQTVTPEAIPTQESLFPVIIEKGASTEIVATRVADSQLLPGVIQSANLQERPNTLLLLIYASLIFAWLMLAIILLIIVRRISEI